MFSSYSSARASAPAVETAPAITAAPTANTMTDSGSGSPALLKAVVRLALLGVVAKSSVMSYQYYQHFQAEKEVGALRKVFDTQPRLLLPPSANIVVEDAAGQPLASARVPSPGDSAANRGPSIRVLSVTARRPEVNVWRKEENRNGVYGLEKVVARVHLFMQPRWALSPNVAPDCTKLETYLRLKKIPYAVHVVNVLYNGESQNAASVNDIPQQLKTPEQREAERQQKAAAMAARLHGPSASGIAATAGHYAHLIHHRLPFVVYRGEIASESIEDIIRFLSDRFHFSPDSSVIASEEDRAMAQAIERSLGFNLRMQYNLGMLQDAPSVYSRYAAQAIGVPAWAVRTYLSLPFLSSMKRDLYRGLRAHDLGALTTAQRHATFRQDIESLEALLRNEGGTRPYLFGAQPTLQDCAIYAYLMPIMRLTATDMEKVNENFRYIAHSRVLRDFVSRVTAAAFPDFDRMVQQVTGVQPAIPFTPRRSSMRSRKTSTASSTRGSVARTGAADCQRQPSVAESTFSTVSRATQMQFQPAPPSQPAAAAAAPAPKPPVVRTTAPSTERQTGATQSPPATATADVPKPRPSTGGAAGVPSPSPAPAVPATSTISPEAFTVISASAIRKTRPPPRRPSESTEATAPAPAAPAAAAAAAVPVATTTTATRGSAPLPPSQLNRPSKTPSPPATSAAASATPSPPPQGSSAAAPSPRPQGAKPPAPLPAAPASVKTSSTVKRTTPSGKSSASATGVRRRTPMNSSITSSNAK